MVVVAAAVVVVVVVVVVGHAHWALRLRTCSLVLVTEAVAVAGWAAAGREAVAGSAGRLCRLVGSMLSLLR